MPEIERNLRAAARKLQGWKSQLAVLLSIGLFSGLLLLLALVDNLSPMQERTNLAILVGLAVFTVVLLGGTLLSAFLRKPHRQSMARKVEDDHPGLMDIFNCAIDLLERKSPDEMNRMEKRVLEEAAKRTSDLSIASSLLPKPGIRGLALLGIAACCGFLVYSQTLGPVRKAVNSYVEMKTGQVTGLLATPGDGEFPRGSDVAIQAHIYRGTREASIEYQVAGGGSAFEPMRLESKADAEPIHFKFVEALDKGIGSILETDIPHGLVPGQAIELSGGGEWAAGIHKVISADGSHLAIAKNPPTGNPPLGEGKLKPLPAQEFYFYGINQPVRYRVVTPELTGAWHTLTSFIPPDIKKITWKITPPPYTQLPASEQAGYGKIRLPEGGLIEFGIEGTPPESMAYLVRDGNELEIDGGNGNWSHHMLPSSDTSFQLLLRTPEKREILSPSVPLEILPDEPPIVEIRKPAKDQQLKQEEMLVVEAYGVDDYGLSQARLVLRLPAGERAVDFPINPVVKQKTLHGSVRLADLGLAVGDYFSYYVEVADNKPSEPQWARSGIYFVEIIPPEMDPQDGQGESPKEIPLRNLINENKRLLRETYTGIPLPQPEKQEQSRKVTSIAHSLEQDMNRVYSENKENFRGELEFLFKGAMEQIGQAEAAASKSLLDQTLAHSEDSLRNLVKIAAMLRRPPSKSQKPSKSEGSEGESQSQPQQQPQGKDQQQNLAEEFQKMQEDLAAAQDLLKQQQTLNPQISRNASTGRKGEPNQKLAGKQGEISKATKALRDRVYGRTGKYAFADPLEKAEKEMAGTKGNLEKDDPSAAQPHGLRAEEALKDAVQTMESAVRQLGTQMIQQLAQESQSLSQQQGELGESTQAGQKGDGERLKNGQQHINRSVDEFLSKMTQVARALEKVSPKANEALFGTASEARKGGVEKSGKRAENALNYEIFKKALEEQEKIKRELDKASLSLDDIQRKLANEGNELLQQALQEIAQQRSELPGMDAGQTEKARKELAAKLSELEATSQNVMLQNIVQQLKHGKFSDQIARNVGETSEILSQAQEVLQTFLWQDALKDAMQQNRETTAPPRKYKGQVQEYFRRLAEGTL